MFAKEQADLLKKRGNDSNSGTIVSWKTEFFQVREYEMIKEAPVQPRGCAGIQSQLRKMAKKTRGEVGH